MLDEVEEGGSRMKRKGERKVGKGEIIEKKPLLRSMQMIWPAIITKFL